MRQFRIIATGQTVSEDDYRVLHPTVSFARNFSPLADAEEVAPDPAKLLEAEIVAHNEPILEALALIDAKSIRPLREGDTERVATLEAQAAALRLQLRKE